MDWLRPLVSCGSVFVVDRTGASAREERLRLALECASALIGELSNSVKKSSHACRSVGVRALTHSIREGYRMSSSAGRPTTTVAAVFWIFPVGIVRRMVEAG